MSIRRNVWQLHVCRVLAAAEMAGPRCQLTTSACSPDGRAHPPRAGKRDLCSGNLGVNRREGAGQKCAPGCAFA